MHIVAGGIKLDQIEGEEQHRNVDKIIEHPNYVDGAVNLGNDACLLKLKKSLKWTEFVQPIPLPAAGKETPAGTRCTVTGWGSINVRKPFVCRSFLFHFSTGLGSEPL